MTQILQVFCIEGHTEVFQSYAGNFKSVFYIYIALIIMKLIYVIQVNKNMFPMKNGLNSINILYTGSHKSFLIHYSHLETNFKVHFSILIMNQM